MRYEKSRIVHEVSEWSGADVDVDVCCYVQEQQQILLLDLM